MPRAFTSGENTADVRAERRINGNGLWVFAGILAVILLMFALFMGGYIFNNAPVNQPTPSTSSERAQP